MNTAFISVFNLTQVVLLVFLGLATFYIFMFSLAGLFYRQPAYPKASRSRKIAVLIPGYKEDDVIVEVAKDALLQEYPRASYDVVVIADSFRPETILRLKELPVILIEVSFEKSTKSKALNSAMQQLTADYEVAVVLDADNLMASDFLTKVNSFFEGEFPAVQGHRTAKNMNTSLAVLDAASEEINNHIFRKGHRVLGLSSAIIGSGMAFRYRFFKELMSTVTAIGGFDKEIEMKMLRDGHKIGYLNDAYVYDEKIQKAEAFTNQRRRWLAAQWVYFRKHILSSLRDLIFRFNVDYFDKVMQSGQPPRVLLLGGVILLTALFLPLNATLQPESVFGPLWLILFFTCILTFIFAVPGSFYNLSTLKALASLPKGMLLMLGSLLKIKGANKQFLHTKHTSSGATEEKSGSSPAKNEA
jgi:cellulose synthase/poly-beta-1,6-N-acetylglucosamine synthase-like glycosyltransferase